MGVWGGLGDISVCRMNTGGTLSQVTILYYFDRVFCSVSYFLLIRNGVLLGGTCVPPQVPRTYEEQDIVIFSLLPNDNSMEILTKQSNKLTGEFISQ